ncbi:hypothetical protein OIU77_030347 [Salix suchowensis]|uniref:Cytochrome P450 n=1 Tax=Salix suchowensis TaxID=1278906 RepID=A0ABQ9BDS7_9ROSI|nr:hypothetical protein OIU77_030347 [Salix suchowensis]
MESAWNLLAGLGLFMSAALFLLLKQRKSRVHTKTHPPGPPAWPIFGNIFDLGAIPHHTFYKLKEKYGPVIWLKLGYTNTLVIQSAEAAAELFKNHDRAFSDRKVPLVLTAHNYNQGSLGIGRYGPNWSMLRRLCSSKLMITKQLDQTAVLRQKCIDDMIKYIEEDVAEAQEQGESGEIKVAHYLFIMTFNLMGNLVLSRDLVNPRSIDGHEFYDAMNKLTKVLHLGLASLLHCFEWELGRNYTPETMDMNEGVGITARKLKPLQAKPKRVGRTANFK